MRLFNWRQQKAEAPTCRIRNYKFMWTSLAVYKKQLHDRINQPLECIMQQLQFGMAKYGDISP